LSLHFFIGGVADAELGQKVILSINRAPSLYLNSLIEKIKNHNRLENFECPKSIYVFDEFSETNSGKIKRKETLNTKPNQVLDL